MQLKLSDISPGDIIEHESWGCNHGGMQERLTRRKGKVIQVTDKVITLQGKNYPETLLVNDLLSGRAKILKVKMRGEEDMVKYDWDTLWPQVQELQAEGKTIVAIAEEMNINLYALKSKLYRERQEEQQTQPPEPEELGGTDPFQENVESATEIIPELEYLKQTGKEEEYGCPFDEPAYNPNPPEDNDFTAEDDEPIPYMVTEEKLFNLDSFKMRVLEIFQEVARANQAPAYVSLAFMNAIIDTYPEKGE